MKKTIFPLMLIMLSCVFHGAGAQQRMDVDMTDRPLGELFDAIEQRTGMKVYGEAGLDSLAVSVRAAAADPVDILRLALSDTPYKVSSYNNSIFILRERLLSAELPRDFYRRGATLGVAAAGAGDNAAFVLSQGDGRGDSQFRTYTIGNPGARVAGRVNVTGYVTNARTGSPVVAAYVILDDNSGYAVTDAYGYYTISVPVGEHTLSFEAVEHSNAPRQLEVFSSGKLDVQMVDQVHTLREISIYAGRRDNVRQTVMGVERLRMSEIRNIPTVFGESDIMRVLISLPGVKAVGEASSGFNVRGGATDQNLILFNDGTVYNPNHMFGLFSAFNPDVVRDMELYKSSIPARFGGRISSVLEINSKEGNKKEFTGAASVGVLTSRLTVEGPIVKDRTSFVFGGRTTYSDWLLGMLPKSSGYNDGRANFYDFNLGVSHNLGERDKLNVNGYMSQDWFRFEVYEQYRYRNSNWSAKWRHFFSNDVIGVVTAGYDQYGYKTENTRERADAYTLKYGIEQVFGKVDFTWNVADKHDLGFGLSAIHYDLMPGSKMPLGRQSLTEDSVLQRERALESAIYVSDKWDVNARLSVDLGVRLSMFNVLGPRDYNLYDPDYLPSEGTITGRKYGQRGILKTWGGPEFRASLRYILGRDLSVKAGVNTMRQYIHKVSNTAVMSPTDTWKLSDVNIRPQSGVQYAVGLYKDIPRRSVEISVEGYYKTMDDYLDYRPAASLVMNPNLETAVFSTQGRAYGLELMLKKTEGKLNGWVSYTWSRTELRQSDPRITDPVNDGGWYPADYDKPHEFKFIGNYKLTHRYSFSLNCEYSTGRPITYPVAKYWLDGKWYLYYSERNRYRIPDYFRMDASFNIEPTPRLTARTHSTITIGVYNLTGRANAHSVFYKENDRGEMQGYKLSVFKTAIPYASYNIRF